MEFFLLIVLVALIGGALKGLTSLLMPSASAIGRAGEHRVNRQALRKLNPEVYTLLSNVTIPTKSGRTAQIDHVILSEFGIFVVETKNYSGWIFGSYNNRQWTQVLYEDKFRFQNPIKQNYGHIRALAELLGLPESKFHNVVCFAGGAEFKTDMPACVQFDTTYVDYILSFSERLLPRHKLGQLAQTIERGRLPEDDPETDKMHIHNVRTQVYEQESGLLCPRCNSPLVLRTARKGPCAGSQFWGCSGFPNCRYTANVRNSR